MKSFIKQGKSAFLFAIAMFVLCGFIYPMGMSAISMLLFPTQANGNLVSFHGQIIGSKYVGQEFDAPYFFHSRPSAIHYNMYTKEEKQQGSYKGVASGSHNYAMSNPKLEKRVHQEIQTLQKENPGLTKRAIPDDLVSESGSGLDPHISVQAATIQIKRVSKASHLSEQQLQHMIKQAREDKVLGFLGEDKVNVLKLNMLIADKLHLYK